MSKGRGPDRRNLLGALAASLGAIVGLFVAPRLAGGRRNGSKAHAEGTDADQRTRRWGMVIDLDRCTGCGACSVACRSENNVPTGGPGDKWRGRRIDWMHLRRTTDGKFPNVRTSVFPMPCNQCEDPACIRVCPVGATYLNEEGLVAQIWDQCIGCRYCMMACPYSRRYFNWFEPEWPESHRNMLNPEVATRPVGVVEKCTFCHHRIRNAQQQARIDGRKLADGDVQTACQEVCPARAIKFGDLDDPNSEVAKLAASPRAFRMLEDVGTKPKVYYLAKDWTP